MPKLCTALLLTVLGCGIDTVPLPEAQRGDSADPTSNVLPLIDSNALYHSDGGFALFFVGTMNAVPGEGILVVSNTDRSTQDHLPTLPNGTFAGAINARIGDTVDLSFLVNGELRATLPGYTLGAASVDALNEAETLQDDFGSDGAAMDAPQVQRTNETVNIVAGPGSVVAGIALIAANLSTGAATETRAENDGSYTISIGASVGDELVIFAVEPAASHGGGAPVIITVQG